MPNNLKDDQACVFRFFNERSVLFSFSFHLNTIYVPTYLLYYFSIFISNVPVLYTPVSEGNLTMQSLKSQPQPSKLPKVLKQQEYIYVPKA